MPIDLRGKNVLITAGSRGLGAIVAEKFAAEGVHGIAINYASNKDAAEQLKGRLENIATIKDIKVVCLQGDAGVIKDCERLVKEATEQLGGLDVLVSNAGYTKFSTFGDLHGNTEEEWDKMWAVNVKGQMALLRAAVPTFKDNADGGSFIMTSSIAGIKTSGSSLPYSVTKAANVHLMRCLAATQGPKVRVNAVLPGLLLTEWGQLYSPDAIQNITNMAALKQVTNLDDCADVFIMLAKNGSMTGVAIKADAGVAIDEL